LRLTPALTSAAGFLAFGKRLQLCLLILFLIEFLNVGNGLRTWSFANPGKRGARIGFQLCDLFEGHVARQFDQVTFGSFVVFLSQNFDWFPTQPERGCACRQARCCRPSTSRSGHRRWRRTRRGFGCAGRFRNLRGVPSRESEPAVARYLRLSDALVYYFNRRPRSRRIASGYRFSGYKIIRSGSYQCIFRSVVRGLRGAALFLGIFARSHWRPAARVRRHLIQSARCPASGSLSRPHLDQPAQRERECAQEFRLPPDQTARPAGR